MTRFKTSGGVAKEELKETRQRCERQRGISSNTGVQQDTRHCNSGTAERAKSVALVGVLEAVEQVPQRIQGYCNGGVA